MKIKYFEHNNGFKINIHYYKFLILSVLNVFGQQKLFERLHRTDIVDSYTSKIILVILLTFLNLE